MSRVTISTIAKKLGVSKMTVSRVINNRPGVSAELRTRVLQFIEEDHYSPSMTARNLALGRTNLISVLVPDMVSEWIAPLLLGIGAEAEDLGYQVLVRSTGRGIAVGPDNPNMFVESELADGLIIASWWIPISYTENLARRSKPLVLIDGYVQPEEDITWVSSDYRQGSIDLVRHLVELGHQRIAFLSGGSKSYTSQMQTTGFMEGMQRSGLAPNPEWVLDGDYTRESGYRLATQILAKKEWPSAIYAANDPMAVGVLQVAHELGINVPADLSVVGFDDTLGINTAPPLTTVSRDYKEIGRTAARLLITQLKGAENPGPAVRINLETRLVVRHSTGAPPAR